MDQKLKYLIIGAGGTGGCIAAYLARAGKDVTLIARGEHGAAIRNQGMKIIRMNDTIMVPVKAVEEKDYQEKADVIYVCVKGYSLDSIYDLVKKASKEDTIVLPVLNIFGTGERMAEKLPGIQVLNGCIYIAAAIEAPGVLRQSGEIFRVVFGRTDGRKDLPRLQKIEADLKESHILPVFSDSIQRDTLQKFSFVSPMAATGVYYDITVVKMQREGKERDTFIECIKEIDALSKAMGITFTEDIITINLKIMDELAPDCTASMQKDINKGGQSEIEGLIYEVVRMGRRYGTAVPVYEKIADWCRSTLPNA